MIACGGTGGHLFLPGLPLPRHCAPRGHESECSIVLRKGSRCPGAFPAETFRFEKTADYWTAPRSILRRFFGFLRRFNESLSLCRSIYRQFNPQGRARYGGLQPRLLRSWLDGCAGVSTFIHESNAVPGKSQPPDRADGGGRSCLVFKECAPFFPKVRTESDRHADSDGVTATRSAPRRAQKLGLSP